MIRRLVEDRSIGPTESALETFVWRALLDAGLEPPERQFEILDRAGRSVARVDFAYPNEKVVIEADGYRFHSAPDDWQRDRRRDDALVALGWTVYRTTWEDVMQRPNAIAGEVATLRWGRSARPGSPRTSDR